jgi:ABC-type branched-subunit amino acid transport system permease subunit
MEWVAIGLLIIAFLWFRPEGVRPEPRRVFDGAPIREEPSVAAIS